MFRGRNLSLKSRGGNSFLLSLVRAVAVLCSSLEWLIIKIWLLVICLTELLECLTTTLND